MVNMKCTYCGKNTKDMTEHLGKNRECSIANARKLNVQFKSIVKEHEKLIKFFKRKD
jgi:hypothetical protein